MTTGCPEYFRLLRNVLHAYRTGTRRDVQAALDAWTHQDATAKSCFDEMARMDAWNILTETERQDWCDRPGPRYVEA